MSFLLAATATDCVHLSVAISGKSCIGGGGTNPIFVYLEAIINLLAAAIGVAVVLAIVIAGFQYITSAGNPDSVKSAKKRLGQAIIGLVLFLMMYGILKFLGSSVLP